MKTRPLDIIHSLNDYLQSADNVPVLGIQWGFRCPKVYVLVDSAD